jgi:hypothetical protein
MEWNASKQNVSKCRSAHGKFRARFNPAFRTLAMIGLLTLFLSAARSEPTKQTSPQQNSPEAVAWSEVGIKAMQEYQGDGVSIAISERGAILRCVFQKLEGEATAEGLWLRSTIPGAGEMERFRVATRSVTRESTKETNGLSSPSRDTLKRGGILQVQDKLVRFIRADLIEEYSVTMDGVRQDFIIEHPVHSEISTVGQPTGELRLELDVSGARVEAAPDGARLVLEGSGRKIAYNRLRAEDARGRALNVRIEVVSANRVAVLVADADAVYPVRIDPTFSDANWVSMGGFPGANSLVNAATVDDSGNLYVGGYFSAAGEVFANGVAKWDGTNWSALGSGVRGATISGVVYALAVSGSNVYVGGGFTNAGGIYASCIAKWDGASWSALGSGMNGQVWALAVSGTNVYAGGTFTNAGGTLAKYIARWDGSNWSALGAGLGVDNYVTALAVSGSNLYVGGYFYYADGILVNRVARWNGNAWSSLGSTLNNVVYALAVSGNDLYVGGAFTQGVAKWNGGWSFVSSGGLGMDNPVLALAFLGNDLYAGGQFGTADGKFISFIARWSGSTWVAVGSGLGHWVYALAPYGNKLYAGGLFWGGSGGMDHVAAWNGTNWSALGPGLDSTIFSLARSGSNVYAGGSFTRFGTNSLNHVAKWNGNDWSPLGSGVILGSALALAIADTNLYVGGGFTNAGGISANRIARWDGLNWSNLGSGMNSTVRALAVSDTNLYAGGDFTIVGGGAASRIAKWNGSAWSGVGLGLDGSVHALAPSGTDLYAAGEFIRATNTGGIVVVVNHIAKWNGTSWSALSSGVNSNAYALTVSGANLYAAGAFITAGGIPANRIARWNGSSWSTLGLGVNNEVYALTLFGTDLYAGGFFTTAGGIPAKSIAKWNGSSWSALGSGTDGQLYALVTLDRDLYVGGFFSVAGNKVSGRIARATLILPANAVPPPFVQNGDFVARFDGTPGITYTIESSDGLVPANWQKATNMTAPITDLGLGVGVFEFRDSTAAPKKFYRAVYPPY